MNNAERISAEYQQVSDTLFWKTFIAEIADMRSKKSRECELLDDVRKSQGHIEALDDIIGRGEHKPPLAERLLEKLRKNQQEVK